MSGNNMYFIAHSIIVISICLNTIYGGWAENFVENNRRKCTWYWLEVFKKETTVENKVKFVKSVCWGAIIFETISLIDNLPL